MTDPTYYSRYEREFAQWARSQGWKVTKQGWPDFICRRDGEVMAVEVKGGNDGLSSAQIATIRDLHRAGFPSFMWTPELGMSDVIHEPLPESVHALRSEVSRLRGLLADLVKVQDRVGNRVVRIRSADDEANGLEQVAAMCRAKHHSHASTVPGERMNLCSWLVAMRDRMSLEEMATIVPIGVETLQRNLDYALNVREDWLHRERHKRMQAGDICADCARAA